MILQPTEVISPVTADISISGLRAYAQLDDLTRFQLVLNVAWELVQFEGGSRPAPGKHPPDEKLANGVIVRNGWLDDSHDVDTQVPEIMRCVELVNAVRERGGRVIVTCAEGRNRSGVVIAEHLIQAGGKPDAVIAHIQAARRRALTNTSFVAWLKRSRT